MKNFKTVFTVNWTNETEVKTDFHECDTIEACYQMAQTKQKMDSDKYRNIFISIDFFIGNDIVYSEVIEEF